MPDAIAGVVNQDGLVVPATPLPTGAAVKILVCEPTEEEQALQEELDAWRLAAANSLETVERMLEESDADEPR
ncbi:MAG: hypothetical protein JNM56_37800 [Planctomycetia bacterium]|nr:hypothetical protein [Planctomycetia bacterium]